MDRMDVYRAGRRAMAICVAVLAALAVSVPAVTQTQPAAGGRVVIIPEPGQPALQQPQPGRPAPPAPRPPGQPPPQTPPRDLSGRPPPQPEVGTASIVGRVSDVDGGQPLRRATVSAFSTSGGPMMRPHVARTDDTGRFELRDLPAGLYVVMARRVGYVERSYGQSGTAQSPPQRVNVADNARVSGIDIALQPAGVIAGRVVDEEGEPAEGIVVQPLRAQRVRGRLRYVPAGRTATADDRGEFRIFGLAPGEYILSAQPPNSRFFGGPAPTGEPGERRGVVATYAPGTPSPHDAQRFVVVPGQEQPAFLQLVEARVASIAGRVVDSTGRPVDSGMVQIRSVDAEVVSGSMTGSPVAPNGTFEISGITPGAYMLSVLAMGRRPMTGPQDLAEAEGASVQVLVAGEDVKDLVITTSPPSSITGRVVVEGDASALQGQALRVMSAPVDPDMMMFGPRGQGQVADDFSVRVSGLRGANTLMVSGLPRGWWVKAVRINGRDAMRGFDFGEGQQLRGLEVVVNDRPASVGGRVTTADGQPAHDYTVMMFPEDLSVFEGRLLPGELGMARGDQDGTFVLEAVRPGTYHVIALEGGIERTLLDDVERLHDLAQRARLLTVQEGEQQYVNLTLEAP
jgi:hypothetical protein